MNYNILLFQQFLNLPIWLQCQTLIAKTFTDHHLDLSISVLQDSQQIHQLVMGTAEVKHYICQEKKLIYAI